MLETDTSGADTQSLLQQTRIILHQPSLPENVGAVARSMRHFGLEKLALVGGVSPLHPRAVATSAGNEDILRQAGLFDTLDDALRGVALALGTTARDQQRPDRQSITPRDAAQLALAHSVHGPVAIVFGTEKHGLSNAELLQMDQIVTIPGEPDTCLNLAHALTILAYEWYLQPAHSTTAIPLNTVAVDHDNASLDTFLIEFLTTHGLLRGRHHASKRHTLQRLLTRTLLTPDEASLLSGWLQALVRNQQAKRSTD
jgi:TrmH family RNA methyltransferase